MIVEKIFNKWILVFLFLIPVLGFIFEEPYYITLTTKVVILGIAGIGLNLALGYCGLISFGHAAFFGLGGYVTGILSFHALNSELIFSWPFVTSGSSEMLVIWPIVILLSAFLALTCISYFAPGYNDSKSISFLLKDEGLFQCLY